MYGGYPTAKTTTKYITNACWYIENGGLDVYLYHLETIFKIHYSVKKLSVSLIQTDKLILFIGCIQ